MQVLAGGGTLGTLTGSNGGVSNISVSTGIRSGTFTLVNNGTFTGTGTAGGSWFTPTVVGVGSLWSVKAVINSSTNTNTTGSFGAFGSLSSGAAWSFTNTATNTEGSGNMTLSFSPDGGATTSGTCTVSWDVGFAP